MPSSERHCLAPQDADSALPRPGNRRLAVEVNEGIQDRAASACARSRYASISSTAEISLRSELFNRFGNCEIENICHGNLPRRYGGECRTSTQNLPACAKPSIKTVDDSGASQDNRASSSSERFVFRCFASRKNFLPWDRIRSIHEVGRGLFGPGSDCCRLRHPRLRGQREFSVSVPASSEKYSAEALRENTLGVAYMNQQKPADAQKYFEKALAADPEFAEARLESGDFVAGPAKAGSRAARPCRKPPQSYPMIPTPGTTSDWHARI